MTADTDLLLLRVLGDWLQERFPRSLVTIVDSRRLLFVHWMKLEVAVKTTTNVTAVSTHSGSHHGPPIRVELCRAGSVEAVQSYLMDEIIARLWEHHAHY